MESKTRKALRRLQTTFNGFTAGMRGAKLRGDMSERQRMSHDFEMGFSEGEAARMRIVEDVAEAVLHGGATADIPVIAPQTNERLMGLGGENPVHELLYYSARLDHAAERLLWAVAEGDAERIAERASSLEEARLIQPNIRLAIDQTRHEIESKLASDHEGAAGWGDPTQEHLMPDEEGGGAS